MSFRILSLLKFFVTPCDFTVQKGVKGKRNIRQQFQQLVCGRHTLFPPIKATRNAQNGSYLVDVNTTQTTLANVS